MKNDYYGYVVDQFQDEVSYLEAPESQQDRHEILLLMLISELKEINDNLSSLEEIISYKE